MTVISAERKFLMVSGQPFKIAVISGTRDPDWVWIRDLVDKDFAVAGRPLEWTRFSTAAVNPPTGEQNSITRFRGAFELANAVKNGGIDLVVSHGPLATAWAATMLGRKKHGARHLAFAFNFTDLPNGLRKRWMTRAFRYVDDFAVFTDAEVNLYKKAFDLPAPKIHRAPWGVAPPLSDIPPKSVDGPYIASLGGEARDYGVLCEAARLKPDVLFVAIARPRNFEGLNPPENLQVHYNLPFEEAWGLVANAEAAVVPLRSRETPCGLVTVVGGMHLGMAQIVTEACGIVDYIENGEQGILTPAGDAAAVASAIDRLMADRALARHLGENARARAARECSEAATVAFFAQYVRRRFA